MKGQVKFNRLKTFKKLFITMIGYKYKLGHKVRVNSGMKDIMIPVYKSRFTKKSDPCNRHGARACHPLTPDLWRSWRRSRLCWRSHRTQTSSTVGWSCSWCRQACHSHRSDPAKDCSLNSHHAPPGSRRHSCHVSQSGDEGIWEGEDVKGLKIHQ